MQFADLEPHLAVGSDLGALVEALSGLSGKERKALSDPLRKACELGAGPRANHSALALAVLGCANGPRQVATGVQWLRISDEGLPWVARVLRDRNPSWLTELPKALLGLRLPWQVRPLLRQIVRAGLVASPDVAAYHVGLAHGLLCWPDTRSVLQALDDDPKILDGELWSMLACEGAGKELSHADKWLTKGWTLPGKPKPPDTPERSWQHALVTLAAAAHLDRDRLLDETLTACLRDWKPIDSAWYIALHDALRPDLDEADSRRTVYLRLLAAAPGSVVGLAQRQLSRLLDADRLDIPALVGASPPALGRPDKGPVLAQLKLLEAAAAGHDQYRKTIAEVVCDALSHPRPDIQERALRVVNELVRDPQQRQDLLLPHNEALAPTLRAAADDGGGRIIAIAAAPMGGAPAAQPATPEPVISLADPSALAELLGQLIEEAPDPIDVERALEAFVRFSRERPRDGGEILARRAKALLGDRFPGPLSGEDIRADLAWLTLVWLRAIGPGPGPRGRVIGHEMADRRFVTIVEPDWTLASLISLRNHEIAGATATGHGSTISLPTHRDGSITAAQLEGRVRALAPTVKPLPLDVGIAALRLAPEDRSALALPRAHRTARLLAAQLATLTAYAPRWEPVIGPSSGLYRDRYEKAATWRDAASPQGRTDDPVAAVLDRRDPLSRLGLEAHDGEYGGHFEQVTALWPLLLPHHPELLAAHAHARLNRALDKNRNGTEPLLDALAHTRTQTGPVVCSALCLGLSAKNGDERTRAIDALVDLARGGHLDGRQLGKQIGWLLEAGVVTGRRVAASLTEADRASPANAGPLVEALQTIVPALPSRRDGHLFVDLLAQVAARTARRIELPEELMKLRLGTSTSSLARACRRVPIPT